MHVATDFALEIPGRIGRRVFQRFRQFGHERLTCINEFKFACVQTNRSRLSGCNRQHLTSRLYNHIQLILCPGSLTGQVHQWLVDFETSSNAQRSTGQFVCWATIKTPGKFTIDDAFNSGFTEVEELTRFCHRRFQITLNSKFALVRRGISTQRQKIGNAIKRLNVDRIVTGLTNGRDNAGRLVPIQSLAVSNCGQSSALDIHYEFAVSAFDPAAGVEINLSRFDVHAVLQRQRIGQHGNQWCQVDLAFCLEIVGWNPGTFHGSEFLPVNFAIGFQ